MTKTSTVKHYLHAYTACSRDNCFRSLDTKKTGLFRTCENFKSPGGTKFQDFKNDLLTKYKLCKNSLNLGKMAVRGKTFRIANKDKYFHRPLVPFLIPKIQTADISDYSEYEVLSRILQNTQNTCHTTSPKSIPHKNVETQTDYRESESQTEPWEPPYKIVPGHNPEILELSYLTWEHGLPAGIHETHIINRMRIKKAWEAILPPMDTTANIKIRNSIITALEIDEWAFRESEIQFIMDLRLKLMKDLLRTREIEYRKKMQNRFNRLHDKLEKHRDDQIKTIKRDLERNLRKLRRKHYDKRYSRKPNIIEQYSDPKSDLYAPQMRFGVHPRDRHEILQKRDLDETYINQEEEEDIMLNWLPIFEKSKVQLIENKSEPVDMCIRETRWTEEKLKQLYTDLKAIRLNAKSTDTIPQLMKRNYKLPALPVTPCRSDTWCGEEKQREESAAFIQKIVRGRAIQCLMYEGRDRCRELIEELQSTQALEQQGQKKCREEKIRTIELQRMQNDKLMQEDRLCEMLNSLEGKTVCGMLDFLSKELIRLEDERRAHAIALLAERERCAREAAEAGRRQMERNRRREFDEMFKQIVKINQDSVETYLEDIITEGIDSVADKAAKEYVLKLCDQIDISQYEKTDILADKKLVTDMIHNFVLPEVEKQNMRKKICNQQQSYIRNAHISVYEEILNLPSVKQSQNEKACIKDEDTQKIWIYDTEQDITIEEGSPNYKKNIKNEK